MSNIAILAMSVYASDLSDKDVYDFEPARTEAIVDETCLPQSPPRSPGSTRSRFRRLFRRASDTEPRPGLSEKGRIFGVPLETSILYANVAITLTDEEGESFVYS